METQPRISETLYVGLYCMLGTPTQVKIRRDVSDTVEMIEQSLAVNQDCRRMESGSCREGFRLKTSDIDVMYWFTDDIIICDLSQIPPYNPTQTLILMECDDTPPGFAKLQLLTPTNNQAIMQSCVSVNDQVYISSSLHREVFHNIAQLFPLHQASKLHGPCTSGFRGQMEYDHAFCFSCQYWPPPAYHWIDKCQRRRWPSPQVLQEIIKEGCHLVAIGSRRSTSPHQCETEWRMSFSKAEYKLVSFMNHTQFLCYGVLKIFLKDVLNVGHEDPLLCSYFMKTTLFWKIQENKISVWCSKNMLHCVWTCFKYLIQCVYRGEFPNFFIPQNNMFINKIHGAAQKQLFLQLMNLYNMGFSCLLLSPSLYKILTKTILYPQLQVSTNETDMIFEAEHDIELFTEISMIRAFRGKKYFKKFYAFERIIDNIYKRIPQCSEYHTVTLHMAKNEFLVHQAFLLDRSRDDNTMHNPDSCRPLDMLISAAESGYISHTLYVAMYLYNKRRYTGALYYIERTKEKLSQTFVLHITTMNVNKERYVEAVGGQSLIDKIRKAASSEIIIDQICCIDELRLEVCIREQNCGNFIIVPPLVMTHMLSFLCHHHLGDGLRSRQSLDELQTLLHYDEGNYIYPLCRDISWQMLGVCEQIYGENQRALYCYQQSLQYNLQDINAASWTRIQNILSK